MNVKLTALVALLGLHGFALGCSDDESGSGSGAGGGAATTGSAAPGTTSNGPASSGSGGEDDDTASSGSPSGPGATGAKYINDYNNLKTYILLNDREHLEEHWEWQIGRLTGVWAEVLRERPTPTI